MTYQNLCNTTDMYRVVVQINKTFVTNNMECNMIAHTG